MGRGAPLFGHPSLAARVHLIVDVGGAVGGDGVRIGGPGGLPGDPILTPAKAAWLAKSEKLFTASWGKSTKTFAAAQTGSPGVMPIDEASAKAAWTRGKENLNGFIRIVNLPISAKVGDKFPFVVESL